MVKKIKSALKLLWDVKCQGLKLKVVANQNLTWAGKLCFPSMFIWKEKDCYGIQTEIVRWKLWLKL